MAKEGDRKARLVSRGSHGQVGGKVFPYWETGLALSLAVRGGVLLKWFWMSVLPGDEAEGQVERGSGCEGKCLQGGRGLLWL